MKALGRLCRDGACGRGEEGGPHNPILAGPPRPFPVALPAPPRTFYGLPPGWISSARSPKRRKMQNEAKCGVRHLCTGCGNDQHQNTFALDNYKTQRTSCQVGSRRARKRWCVCRGTREQHRERRDGDNFLTPLRGRGHQRYRLADIHSALSQRLQQGRVVTCREVAISPRSL